MTRQPIEVTFYFDFLCPFVYRTTQWIDNLQHQLGDDLIVNWRYFSLEQGNTPDDSDWKIWEQPEDYECVLPKKRQRNRALLAFWAAEAARKQGPEAFGRFRRAVFRARHDERQDISERATLEAAAEKAELDMDRFRRDFADRSLIDVIRRDYEEAREKYNVFGVPTVCFDDENAVYLKLMEVPPLEDTLAVFHDLRNSFLQRRWLAELKRPNP